MMWNYGYGFNWFTMSLMAIGMILFILLLVVLAWAIIRKLGDKATRTMLTPTRESSPTMEVLRQRYAHGEIDSDTFNRMRTELEGTEMPLQQQREPLSNRR